MHPSKNHNITKKALKHFQQDFWIRQLERCQTTASQSHEKGKRYRNQKRTQAKIKGPKTNTNFKSITTD